MRNLDIFLYVIRMYITWICVLHGVLLRVLGCCDGPMAKMTSRVPVHPWEKSSRNQEAGTEAEATKECCLLTSSPRLAQLALELALWSPARHGTTQREMGPLTPHVNQDKVPPTCRLADLKEVFPQLRVPLHRWLCLCQVSRPQPGRCCMDIFCTDVSILSYLYMNMLYEHA